MDVKKRIYLTVILISTTLSLSSLFFGLGIQALIDDDNEWRANLGNPALTQPELALEKVEDDRA